MWTLLRPGTTSTTTSASRFDLTPLCSTNIFIIPFFGLGAVRQRQLQREQRHRERVERDRLRPSSPPPIVHYSDHEASAIAEKLKQDESFPKTCQTLIAWLERGDCNKKNSNTFYSMVQSTNAHVRRLLSEKSGYDDELNKAKEGHRKQMQFLSSQRK